MPFAATRDDRSEDYWTSHFEDFLKPMIENKWETVQVLRSKPLRRNILNEIVTHLVTAEVVVADLTDVNPNVFWELGVRQSFRHGTITIAQQGSPLPFDVARKATHYYKPKGDNLRFKTGFLEALEDALANPDTPDSDVLDTLSGGGTLYEIFNSEEALRRLAGVQLELDTNLALLEAIESCLAHPRRGGPRRIVTQRLRFAAAEFLLVSRYVAGPERFYPLIHDYCDRIDAFNSQLVVWEYSLDATERWLREATPEAKDIFRQVKETIGEASHRLHDVRTRR